MSIAALLQRGELCYVSRQGYRVIAGHLDGTPYLYDFHMKTLHHLTADAPDFVREADVERQAVPTILGGMREALAAGRVFA